MMTNKGLLGLPGWPLEPLGSWPGERDEETSSSARSARAHLFPAGVCRGWLLTLWGHFGVVWILALTLTSCVTSDGVLDTALCLCFLVLSQTGSEGSCQMNLLGELSRILHRKQLEQSSSNTCPGWQCSLSWDLGANPSSTNFLCFGVRRCGVWKRCIK